MIVEMDLYAQIRTLYNEGFSQRNIAHRLGISRQTVKKYCEGNTHPDERKPYHRESEVLTQDVLDFILAAGEFIDDLYCIHCCFCWLLNKSTIAFR